ncbi:discoidin domain-containing protein [Paenibacillus albidus]|uniref:discoidin domain-containing protein n=1 Tax=Paenibacillus albidus TaxID=2041023 RepID=UPI002034D2D3|nr:right-handed parallel beta-helix repeat-containing protein [Paenibacillus albidus]
MQPLLASLRSIAANSGSPAVYGVDVTDYVTDRLEQGEVSFMLADAAASGVSVNIYSKEANGVSNPQPQLSIIRLTEAGSDTQPPVWEQGAGLSAHNWGTDFVDLEWPEATDNTAVTLYRIYKGETLIGEHTGTAYRAAGLEAGTAYSFKVEAVDAAGNFSNRLSIDRKTLSSPILPWPVRAVTASGSDGNLETNVLDNNSYTRWSAAGDGQWIALDLGESRDLGYVGIGFYKGNVRSTSIEIETSEDGTVWTPVFSGKSSGGTAEMQAFDLPDSSARYVKITGRGNSDGSVYMSLTDVHLYEPYAGGGTPVAIIPYMEPETPEGTVPFTAPGLTNPDGTGHAVHTPHSVTGRTIDVRDYGANPADNGVDDRPAIQAAIDAAAAGDEVFLPSGVYHLLTAPDGTTNLSLKSGVNLRGESEKGTLLITSLNLVTHSAAIKASSQHDIVLSNMTLSSTWSGRYSTDHQNNNMEAGGPDTMIRIANYGDNPSYNITVDHVTVEKFRRMGIRIEHSRDVTVKNATFRNATDLGPGGSGYGVSIQGTPKTDRLGFENDTKWNVVEDSAFEGPYLRHGALIQFVAHNNVLRNNTFTGTKLDAIDLHGELEYLNEIYGNVITDVLTGAAIGLGNTGGSAPSNHSKSGAGNYIHDNIIKHCRNGIVVIMGTPDTVIENNVIENTTDITGAAGIKILNGPGTIIRNNVIRNNTTDSYWAILLEQDKGDAAAGNIGAGVPRNVRIEGNNIAGNTNGIGLFAGTGILLKNNLLDNLTVNYYQAPDVTLSEE